jgi:hypothetical protein
MKLLLLFRAARAVHPMLRRSMQVAAIAGIAAFLSFPIGLHAPHASVARWLSELADYVH